MSHVKIPKGVQVSSWATAPGTEETYNPGQQNLQVNALATLLNNAQQKIDEVRIVTIAYNHAVNDRAARTEEAVKLAGRVFNLLKAMNLSAATLADARSLVRSLRAKVAASPEPETAPESMPPCAEPAVATMVHALPVSRSW